MDGSHAATKQAIKMTANHFLITTCLLTEFE